MAPSVAFVALLHLSLSTAFCPPHATHIRTRLTPPQPLLSHTQGDQTNALAKYGHLQAEIDALKRKEAEIMGVIGGEQKDTLLSFFPWRKILYANQLREIEKEIDWRREEQRQLQMEYYELLPSE